MATINQLPLQSNVSTADQLVVYSIDNGDARRTPINALTTLLMNQFVNPGTSIQFVQPINGATITVTTTADLNTWLIIQPGVTIATATIVFPSADTIQTGSELVINSTQQITAVTFSTPGASTLYGVVGSLSAEDFIRFRYYSNTNSWYRVA